MKYKCQYNQLEDICIITNCYLNVCFDMNHVMAATPATDGYPASYN